VRLLGVGAHGLAEESAASAGAALFPFSP